MRYENIIYEREDGIAIITLNRPDKLNALNDKILQEIAKAVDESREDDGVKAVIITGAGRAFCSGADITASIRGADPKQPGINRPFKLEPFVSFGAVMKRLHDFHKPAIAAINGISAGAGLSMACLCDIRIASEEAQFSAIFVRRGLVADSGITYMLPRIVGIEKALELIWTGDIIDAKEAHRVGLVGTIVPHAQLMAKAKELAIRFVKGPSVAIELMKKLVYDGLNANDFSASIAYEAWAQEMCYLTDDYQEAIQAFKEKRPANFVGK